MALARLRAVSEVACAASPPSRATSLSHPDGRDDCIEKKNGSLSEWVNPAILQKITPETLRDLASEDAVLCLDAVEDWRDALPYLLRELDVNVSAWLDAADVMGEEVVFIALLVIDRNRFHPVTPIHSPGGALRAFTKRAIRGEFSVPRTNSFGVRCYQCANTDKILIKRKIPLPDSRGELIDAGVAG